MSTVLLQGDLKWPPPPLPPPPAPKTPPPPKEVVDEGPVDLYKPTLSNALVTTGGIAGIVGMGFISPGTTPPSHGLPYVCCV